MKILGFQSQCFQPKSKNSSFFRKRFRFPKICFEVKVVKTLKVSSDFHIKICRSIKRRAVLKISSTAF